MYIYIYIYLSINFHIHMHTISIFMSCVHCESSRASPRHFTHCGCAFTTCRRSSEVCVRMKQDAAGDSRSRRHHMAGYGRESLEAVVRDMASLRGTILTLGESWGCAFMMLRLVMIL